MSMVGEEPRSMRRGGGLGFAQIIFVILAAMGAIANWAVAAPGQIYITDSGSHVVGEYGLDGSIIKSSLITGLARPRGIASAGSSLFVANYRTGIVGQYSSSGVIMNSAVVNGSGEAKGLAISGTTLFVAVGNQVQEISLADPGITNSAESGGAANPAVISQLTATFTLTWPTGLAVYGDDLFVSNWNSTTNANSPGYIAEYDIATGEPIAVPFISNLRTPTGILVVGTDLFVAEYSTGVIAKYTATGTLINPNFITGLAGPVGLALSPDGAALYVANFDGGTIGEYALTGQAINPSLITGLRNPAYIVVVPEPKPWEALVGGGLLYVTRLRPRWSGSLASNLIRT
ncbi:MAG TPA: hypothetical protein VG722_09400 [Tepidisphaeraceae bacterium]|nr:hypothetical protein [Tepidisphaeraceae bacterium]